MRVLDMLWTYLYGIGALLIVGVVAVSGVLSMKYMYEKRRKK